MVWIRPSATNGGPWRTEGTYGATASDLEEQSGAHLADCAVVEPIAEARDDELARKVWKLSEERVAGA